VIIHPARRALLKQGTLLGRGSKLPIDCESAEVVPEPVRVGGHATLAAAASDDLR
jgi:predicted PhzF superfamily epimerase YddE/YHI9